MNKKTERVRTAVSEIMRLEEIHEEFIAFVQTLTTITSSAGEFGTSNNNLTAKCLGITLKVNRKVVTIGGMPAFMEYAFTIGEKENEFAVFVMYLGTGGVLYTDPQSKNKLCDYNNTYLSKNVLNAMATNLLGSKVFAPTVNG